MNTRSIRINRRAVVTAAGGLVGGMVATGALAVADGYQRTPSVTVIGEKAAQFSLVHAGGVKVGVLFGLPTTALLSAIPPMLGWTAPQLDVLAISPNSLTSDTGGWLTNQTHLRTVLILGPLASAQLPALRSGVQVRTLAGPATVGSSPDVALDFLPSFTTDVVAGTVNATGAAVAIRHGRQTIAIAGEPSAVLHQPIASSPALIVTPAGDLRPLVAAVRPRAVAINGDESLEEQIAPEDLALPNGQMALLRTYLSSPAVVELGPGALRLPSWTRMLASPAAGGG